MDQYSYSQFGDSSIYIRKCYGFETHFTTQRFVIVLLHHLMFQFFTNHLPTHSVSYEGTGHMSFSALVDSPVTHEQGKVYETWTRLRFLVPQLGSTTFGASPPDGAFYFQYVVPANAADASGWAKRTVKFDSIPASSLFERHRIISKQKFWGPSAHHANAELHVCPTVDGGWIYSLVAGHEIMDARGALAVLDLFLQQLDDSLRGVAPPLESIKWGDEVQRLSPASAVVIGGPHTETKLPIAIGGPNAAAMAAVENEGEDETRNKLASLFAYLRPWRVSGEAAHATKLSAAHTTAFHGAAKAAGGTISHVATALAMIAHAEVYLRAEALRDPCQFKQIAAGWLATPYLFMLSPADERSHFPKEYSALDAPRGSPLLALGGSIVLLPLENVKKIVIADPETCTVQRVWDKRLFETLVQDVVGTMKSAAHSAEAFLALEAEVEKGDIAKSFVSTFPIPKLEMVSSVGNVDRMNLFKRFQDVEDGSRTLVLRDLTSNVRCEGAAHFKLSVFQYAQELRFQWRAGGGPEGGIDDLAHSFKAIVDSFLGEQGCLVDIGVDLDSTGN
ncbi:hypothetical protein FISHEDRAFT_73661 [Fistulina hepatica ATCC 64428]|uniref:CoA-dependent acyltransferase n=1 Tax=Fistulina hepatica ATCC 64428 TaxID=1128425 RepID=A0A0D7ACT2_9AGAR|nr:hypothetical protein FISHEDRAFT_73661 [Fistulina hepatica ATCC 64428]